MIVFNRSIVHTRSLSIRCAWAAAILLAGAVTFSHAQQSAWRPERTVEIVLPSAAGSSLDGASRLIQKILQENRIVDVPVVVMNKAGGGGSIATNYLDQYAGDGHYLFKSAMSIMNNHILGRSKTNYTHYTPIAVLYSEHMTVVVPPNSPLKSGRDIMERLKRDPQALSVAVGFAPGGTNHLNIALLMNAMGVDVKKIKTVVFQGNVHALTALMGGHVDMSSMSFAQAWNAAQQGQLRIIGVASDRRLEGPLANIPTWKEQGFDVVFSNTRFMLGPKGMSPAQTAYWDAALRQVIQSDEWKKMAEKNYYVSDYVGHEESPQRLAAMYKLIKEALTAVGMAKE